VLQGEVYRHEVAKETSRQIAGGRHAGEVAGAVLCEVGKGQAMRV